MITLPLHTSHAMQPIDICLFKPFKAYRDYWKYKYPEFTVNKQNLAQWVTLALKKAMILENILKGFSTMGICQMNDAAMADKLGPLKVYNS
jgi:hypothetical protein